MGLQQYCLMLMTSGRLLLIAFLFSSFANVQAHQSTNSYLSVSVQDTELLWRWDVALADLLHVVPLDETKDGVIAWAELEAKVNVVLQYALLHLLVRADGQLCPLEPAEDKLGSRNDKTFATVQLVCKMPDPAKIELTYTALFEADPKHRGLLRLYWNGETRASVFTAGTTVQTFMAGDVSGTRQFVTFLREGITHIWTGYDHIMFLLSLLLPAVLMRKERAWEPVNSFRPALIQIVKVVTAFTVAHSITLTLATLGIVKPPPRWIESIIAASVFIAALNNLFRVLKGNAWMLAFGFGLIHGFGFANALAEMELPKTKLAVTLLSFNLGVESGQLAIVVVFLPLAFGLRASWFYWRIMLQGGSALVCAVALTWIFERVFDLKLLPF